MNHFAGPKVGVRGLGSCGCMNRTIENLSDDCRKLISGENLCFRDNSSQSSRNVTCWQAGNSVPRTHHHHHHHSSPPLQQSLTNLCLTDLNLRPPPAEILRPAYLLSTLCWLLLSRRDISTLSRSLACVDIYIHIYISTQHAVCRTSGVCTTAATTSNASCFYKHTDVLLRTAGKLL